jgi:WD40 repeat protein
MLGNATLLMHGRSVNSVAFHPTANPPLLATGSSDKTVKLWSFVNIRGAMRTKDLATLEGHSKSVNCVSFHPTAPFLATCSDDNTVKLWMLVALNSTPAIVICVATLRGNSIVNSVAFHPTAPLMASSADNTVKLWNFEQFTIMWQRMLVLHRMSGMTRTLTTRLGIDPRHSEPGSQLIKNLSRKVESKLQRNIVDFFADHPPTQLKQLQEMILRRSLTTPKRHNKQKQLTLVSPVVLDDH